MTFPQPPIAADADLRDFPFMPLDVLRLRDSELAALSSGDGFRCAVLLWCAGWHQKPAGSLPDDDVALAQLAGFGRVVREWLKVKAEALRGWVKCSDGRLYHPVVTEKAIEAWNAKLEQRWRSECARIKKHNQRHSKNDPLPTLEQYLSSRQSTHVPGDTPPLSLGTPNPCPDAVPGETPSKRQGQGINDDDDSAPELPHIALTRKILAIMGTNLDDEKFYGSMARVQMWLKQGWTPEIIIPGVQKMMASRGALGAPGHINYVEKSIAGYAADLARPLPEVTNVNGTHAQNRPAKPNLDDQFAELDRLGSGGPVPMEPFPDLTGGDVIEQLAVSH